MTATDNHSPVEPNQVRASARSRIATPPGARQDAQLDGIEPATPAWLDDREMAAWLGFIETQGDLMTALENDLADTGLSLGDYQVFVYLSRADRQSMRMSDLAAQLQLTPSGLTRRLDGLVEAGWIERRHSSSDRRVMLGVLTESGRQLLERVAPIHLASVRARIIDLLDDHELVAMASIFAKIRSGLDN